MIAAIAFCTLKRAFMQVVIWDKKVWSDDKFIGFVALK